MQRQFTEKGVLIFSELGTLPKLWDLWCRVAFLLCRKICGDTGIFCQNVMLVIFFGEPYAASPGAVLNVSVAADEDCEIIFLNVQRLLVSCPTACEHHQKLIRNLVSVLANKILILNDKITHVGKRTTRDKLLSYLSAESIRQSSLSFDIPFDRQQLADYLCIDRAAMSTEISKLQKDGFIKTNRKHFELIVSVFR